MEGDLHLGSQEVNSMGVDKWLKTKPRGTQAAKEPQRRRRYVGQGRASWRGESSGRKRKCQRCFMLPSKIRVEKKRLLTL